MLLCLPFVVLKMTASLCLVWKHHHCPGQGLPLLEVSGQQVLEEADLRKSCAAAGQVATDCPAAENMGSGTRTVAASSSKW